MRILDSESAESNEELGVLGDGVPRCGVDDDFLEVSEDVGYDDFSGGIAVGIERSGIASDAVEESVELALGVMESSGTCPSVRTSEDGLIAVCFYDS